MDIRYLRSRPISEKARREKFQYKHRFEPVFADSTCMQQAMNFVRQVAPFHSVVLLYGDHGTGKTFLASKIHELSDRCSEPFLCVNCRWIDEQILRPLLFGTRIAEHHRSGLFQSAHKGTILLKNIDYLSKSLQSDILKVIQDRSFVPVGGNERQVFSARIMATMIRTPGHYMAGAEFQRDFYYRISVFPIRVGSLLERKQDFKKLVIFFLNNELQKRGLGSVKIPDRFWFILSSHNWSGNVAELRSVLESVSTQVLPQDDMVLLKHLPVNISLLYENNQFSRISSNYDPYSPFKQDQIGIIPKLKINDGIPI